jgi:hypothetical protein
MCPGGLDHGRIAKPGDMYLFLGAGSGSAVAVAALASVLLGAGSYNIS